MRYSLLRISMMHVEVESASRVAIGRGSEHKAQGKIKMCTMAPDTPSGSLRVFYGILNQWWNHLLVPLRLDAVRPRRCRQRGINAKEGSKEKTELGEGKSSPKHGELDR